jgi:hypothetical protein
MTSQSLIGSVWSDSALRFDPTQAGTVGTESSNLLLWLDAADSSTISNSGLSTFQWRDKSINQNHFNVRTSYSAPTYVAATNSTRPYVDFASINVSINSSKAWTTNTAGSALTSTSQRWMYVVYSCPAAAGQPNSRMGLWFGNNAASNLAFGMDMFNSTNGAQLSYWPYTYGTGDITGTANNQPAHTIATVSAGYYPDGANKVAGTPGTVFGQWSLFTGGQGNTMTTRTGIAVNTATTGTGGTGLTLTDFSRIYIGGRRNDGQTMSGFRVYEVLMFSTMDGQQQFSGSSSTPNNFARAKVQAYLGQKWGNLSTCVGFTVGNFMR